MAAAVPLDSRVRPDPGAVFRLPYRVAAGVLQQLLPLDAGPETLRTQTLKVGEDLRDAAPAEPATAAAAITLSVDSTFIRSCEAGPRHLEVRLGNVETPNGRA